MRSSLQAVNCAHHTTILSSDVPIHTVGQDRNSAKRKQRLWNIQRKRAKACASRRTANQNNCFRGHRKSGVATKRQAYGRGGLSPTFSPPIPFVRISLLSESMIYDVNSAIYKTFLSSAVQAKGFSGFGFFFLPLLRRSLSGQQLRSHRPTFEKKPREPRIRTDKDKPVHND